eukprot:3532804-Rhodomonas_salina.2
MSPVPFLLGTFHTGVESASYHERTTYPRDLVLLMFRIKPTLLPGAHDILRGSPGLPLAEGSGTESEDNL